MQSKEMLRILKKYKETDMLVIKHNLRNVCSEIQGQYGGKKELAKVLDVELSALLSYLNLVHPSKITFENFIKFCGILELSVDDMLTDNGISERKKARNKEVFWTEEKKKEFIERYELGGIKSVQEKFKLSEKTILHYYNVYTK